MINIVKLFTTCLLITMLIILSLPGLSSAQNIINSNQENSTFNDSFSLTSKEFNKQINDGISIKPRTTYVPNPISGVVNILIVPVKFIDVSNTTTIENIIRDKILPLVRYYHEVSYGALEVDGVYFESWFTLNHTLAYYGQNSGSTKDINIDEYFRASLEDADPYVNYHNYDFVIIVHAGNDEAMTGNPNDIWSRATLGKQYYTYDGGVRLGLLTVAENDPYGVYVHEFGHNLGLPDLYDTSYKEMFVGPWSVMDIGSWLNPPSSIMAVEKIWLGWIPTTNITSVSYGQILNVTISRLEYPGNVLAVKIPLASSTYYIIEYRTKVLTDSALPMSGALISYVDTSLGSGKGIVRVVDANNSTKNDLNDAAFVSGMKFINSANSVAVRIWYLNPQNAYVMVQRGFADLFVDNIQLVGNPMEGEDLYFDVRIGNKGITPSNFAIVSLIINGTKVQEKGLPAVNPSLFSVIRLGPWRGVSGKYNVSVIVDANNNVVEMDKSNNVGSTFFNILQQYVYIDKAFVSKPRADVGSGQKIFFHVAWKNGTSVNSGILYVNNTGYMINSTGWAMLYTTSSHIGKTTFHVTGVNINSVTGFYQNVPDPNIIWDRVVFILSVLDNRVNVGSTAQIIVKSMYEYDNAPFDGEYILNDTLTKRIVGKYYYTIRSINDHKYGLTIFESNTVSVIFDRIKITWYNVSDDRCDVGSTQQIRVKLALEYDDLPLGLNDQVYINGSLAKYDITNRYFYINYSSNKVGRFTFNISSATQSTYNITVLKAMQELPSIIFDKIRLVLSVVDDRIDVGDRAQFIVTGVYIYDGKEGRGTYTLNDTTIKSTVGKYGYKITSITDDIYGLTTFESNTVSVIFDRIKIILKSDYTRVNVGSKAPISWSGIYEYDNAPFDGEIFLNEDLIKYSISNVSYKVIKITDKLYGLTAFLSNDVYIIFDEITYNIKTDSITPGSIKIALTLKYTSDNSPVTNANVIIGNTKANYIGNGEYTAEFRELTPYTSYQIIINKQGFKTINYTLSTILIGNTIIILIGASLAIIITAFILRRK
ncbi:MAG: M6 family metalloprotease domain-containing protein [Thermoprotei archaeon]